MRAQEGKEPAKCALNKMGRMEPSPRFYGHKNDPGIEVDILGTLYMETPDGQA